LAGIRKGDPSADRGQSVPRAVSPGSGRRQKHMKMKIFTGYGDTVVLEGELNEWLAKNPYITIRNIRQSYVSSKEQLCTLMSVWYDN
jgi:hypothetical protein